MSNVSTTTLEGVRKHIHEVRNSIIRSAEDNAEDSAEDGTEDKAGVADVEVGVGGTEPAEVGVDAEERNTARR